MAEIKAIELEENEELAARDREKAEQLKQLEKERQKEQVEAKRSNSSRDSTMDRFTKNLMSQVGREVGRVISRGILGILKK